MTFLISTKVTTYTRNSYTYNGENVDLIPGVPDLQYLRARYYDPNMGRFMQQDTLFGEMERPLTQNLYVYCLNNGVNLRDPSGNRSLSSIDNDIARYQKQLDDAKRVNAGNSVYRGIEDTLSRLRSERAQESDRLEKEKAATQNSGGQKPGDKPSNPKPGGTGSGNSGSGNNGNNLTPSGGGNSGNSLGVYIPEDPKEKELLLKQLKDEADLKKASPFFNTPEEAAIHFANKINPISILEGFEYAATIYIKDGKYYYNYVRTDKNPRSVIPNIPWSWLSGVFPFVNNDVVATIHTHGGYKNLIEISELNEIPELNHPYNSDDWNDIFSPQDMENSVKKGFNNYLASPAGILLKFDNQTRITSRITTDIPFDPRDPHRDLLLGGLL